MLIHQGARAVELWTGMRAPVEVMREALRQRQYEAQNVIRDA
jgi:shikimate 5-dehydrogenase